MQQLRAEEEKVRTTHEEKVSVADHRIQQLRDDQAQCNLKLQKVKYEHLHQKEMADCEDGINELRKRDKELELTIRQQQEELNRLRQECEWKAKELKWEFQTKTEAVRKDRSVAEEQLQTLNDLIEKRKGSLCEWLEKNKPDWKETIGKVADEELVLYNSELQPQLTNQEETSLFGISLNLSAIERSVRTPEEMKRERDKLQTAWQLCTDRLNRLTQEGDEAVSTLEKKYSKQIRTILEEQHLMEAERMQIPAKRKNLQADYASWKTKEEDWKKERTEEFQAQLNEIAHRLYVIAGEKEKLVAEREKSLKACQKTYKDGKAELQKKQDEFVAGVRQEIDRLKQQTAERKKDLKQAQENELSGKGADTTTIRKYDDRLAEIKKELDYINESRPQVLYYERDKAELFDKEPATRSRKKEADAKLIALDERFALKKEKLQLQLKEVDGKLDRIHNELHLLESGLNKVDMFRKDETFCPPSVTEVGEKPTRKSCDTIVEEFNDDFVKRNFAGVIKEIALRPLQSSDKLMQLLLEIKRFNDENQHTMGKVDLFSQASREDVNATAVRYLLSFMKYLLDEPARKRLALADTFKLEFRVKENDNDTGWVEKIANVGSDGTDILVKAMVNIMLINVFKEKASRTFGDFKIHCMMDEIGKLHPNNVKGILDFANCRNILLVNSSPTTYNVEDYRYTYLLSKDGQSNTQVVPLLTYKQKENER